tara:strand:- start:28 stop:651 length:624 start_codon:yes stop_codon:yes gene_type:complete
MKIYFDGCSWTRGEELQHPEHNRFSRLVCNQLGAQEVNLSMKGGSNDRIVRNLYCDNTIKECDLAVIQMTFPARTEYFKGGEWRKVNPMQNYTKWLHGENGDIKRLGEKFADHADFWKYFYMQVANREYFMTKERIQYETIRDNLRRRGIPLIIGTINRWTLLDFDIQMNNNNRHKCTYGHPNEEGHRLLSARILKILKSYQETGLL